MTELWLSVGEREPAFPADATGSWFTNLVTGYIELCLILFEFIFIPSYILISHTIIVCVFSPFPLKKKQFVKMFMFYFCYFCLFLDLLHWLIICVYQQLFCFIFTFVLCLL